MFIAGIRALLSALQLLHRRYERFFMCQVGYFARLRTE